MNGSDTPPAEKCKEFIKEPVDAGVPGILFLI